MEAGVLEIFRRRSLVEQPWKNGGGITREIAAHRDGAKLIWRLSMADVASDGPFSRFDGLMRVLTVIDGHGMELIAPGETMQADYGKPVWFSGGLDIVSKLKHGPLRDLNLIFDPQACGAAVDARLNVKALQVSAGPSQISVLHVMKGEVALPSYDGASAGDTVMLRNGGLRCHADQGTDVLILTLTLKAG